MSPKPSTVSRMRNAGEVHHRVADVAELEVEDRGDVAVLVVELPGVPHDRCLAALRVDRVAGEPPEAELEERVGPHLGARGSRPRRRRMPTTPDCAGRRGADDPGPHVAARGRARGCGRGCPCTRPSPRRARRRWRRRSCSRPATDGDHEGARLVAPAVDVRRPGCRPPRAAPGTASRARAGRAARRRCGRRAP